LDEWLMDHRARTVRADLRSWLEEHAADLCPSHRFAEQLKVAPPESIAGSPDPRLDPFAATEREPSRPAAFAELEAMTSPTEREEGLPAMLEMELEACDSGDEEGQS
jgi:sugar (pentulose or hexulose) kinase